MALNWYLTIRNLAKTDSVAAELYEQLQKAETDDQKELAKQNAKEYIENQQCDKSTDSAVPETSILDTEPSGQDDIQLCDETRDCGNPEDRRESESESAQEESVEEIKTDLSQPAFNPRLAKCGITREEELFLQGVKVRKMSHEEKILMRRSIYKKKTERNAKVQAEYRAKRQEEKVKELNDPERIRFHQERKYVSAVVDALVNHKNLIYIFSEIEGLTPDILKELLKNPGNANAINQANPRFLENFKKAYGE